MCINSALNPTQYLDFLSGPIDIIDLDDVARTFAVSVIVNGQNITWDFTQIGTILATIVVLGRRSLSHLYSTGRRGRL